MATVYCWLLISAPALCYLASKTFPSHFVQRGMNSVGEEGKGDCSGNITFQCLGLYSPLDFAVIIY